MNPEAEALISEVNKAANSSASLLSGMSKALRLLVSWVLSIESRLEKIGGKDGA